MNAQYSIFCNVLESIIFSNDQQEANVPLRISLIVFGNFIHFNASQERNAFDWISYNDNDGKVIDSKFLTSKI